MARTCLRTAFYAVPTMPVLIVVHIVLCIAVSGFAGIIPSALARVFPAKVRSTGTSFSYNIAAIFFAGFTPALMTALPSGCCCGGMLEFFAVGFIARPLGAIVLGSYGDTHGRKATLTLTVALMAVGTFIIGFAPPFWAIGIGTPILLLVGRLFQGFSAGGEIGVATAYLVERAPVERRAGLTGWLQGSMGLANAMSALIGVVITSTFSQSELTEWAWRIPFFIGLLIVPVAVYIRKQLDETEEFLNMKEAMGTEKRSPIRELFRHYPKQLVVAALMAILWTVSVYALVIYATTYYSSKTVGLGFTPNEALWASLVGNAFMIFACVYAGRLADRFGTERTLRWMTWLLIAVPVPALVVQHEHRRRVCVPAVLEMS